ncbi:flagellar brake domain-containing protein [Endothiovibrio diazotrophicus]
MSNENKEQAVDLGTLIQVEVGGLNSRLPTHLIGIEPGRYWILRTPDKIVRGDYPLSSGDFVVLRYLWEGTAYAFRAEILAFNNHPDRLMFIAAPKEVAELSLRAMERLTALLPARLGIAERRLNGALENISKSGCRFVTRKEQLEESGIQPEKGTEVAIEFAVTGLEGLQQIPGTVCNVDHPTDRWYLGIKFAPFTHEEQHRAVERVLSSR